MQKKLNNSNQESILFSISNAGSVANITFNRPKVYNALDLGMIIQLDKYLSQVTNDGKIKLLVITASGEHFSTGADLNWMQNSINYTTEQNFQDASQLARMLFNLYNLEKPVICAMQGNVFGGAMAIVASADITIAASNCKFCFPEVKLGLAPAIVSPFVLQAINNSNFARYAMLTAKPFDAFQAQRIGLVQEITELTALSEAITQNINNLLSLNFDGIMATKRLLRTLCQQISWENLEYCAKTIANLRTLPQAQLLIKQFLHKQTKE